MSGSSNTPGCDPGLATGINSSLQFQVNCPTTARIGRTVPMTILFGNAGNVDIPLPTRILSGTFLNDATGPPVGFNVSDLSQNNQSIYIEFREPGGPPNVLRAGANSGITLYTKTVRRGRVTFKLK